MSQLNDDTLDKNNVEAKEDSSNELEVTNEMFDNMTDDEFNEYIMNGKLPDNVQQVNSNEEESNSDSNLEEVSESNNEVEDEETDDKPNEEEINEDLEEPVQDKEEQIDYEKAYKELFDTPIKADGSEIKLKNKEELISLVQKGANYTRKSQELSKKKKIIQSLEEANIKTEEDLNLLIDIYKGNPKAINSFIKSKKIELDSYEDDDENSTYIPSNNIVSDKEVEFNDIITEIKKSPYKDKISNILNDIWDKESVDMISKDSALLAGLYGEVSQGRFEELQAKVVRDKLFGTEKEPDIIKYMKFAKELEDNKTKPIQDLLNSKPKTIISGNKKSASINKNTIKTSKKVITPEDIDKLSDEEILKLKL